eukprot:NODE_442_length_2246_cov_24.826127_g408_i0.p1 GENE.NODE_442_length_2246_cov_24.826127_g408_i0~~NODE_442_length_2246_cov_24.826127_g408_i0.p1  ORF type:complete len:569 (+),score=94.51 NODE_442_length_2246_cov_24.826127_g408_i0:164-1870(+)
MSRMPRTITITPLQIQWVSPSSQPTVITIKVGEDTQKTGIAEGRRLTFQLNDDVRIKGSARPMRGTARVGLNTLPFTQPIVWLDLKDKEAKQTARLQLLVEYDGEAPLASYPSPSRETFADRYGSTTRSDYLRYAEPLPASSIYVPASPPPVYVSPQFGVGAGPAAGGAIVGVTIEEAVGSLGPAPYVEVRIGPSYSTATRSCAAGPGSTYVWGEQFRLEVVPGDIVDFFVRDTTADDSVIGAAAVPTQRLLASVHPLDLPLTGGVGRLLVSVSAALPVVQHSIPRPASVVRQEPVVVAPSAPGNIEIIRRFPPGCGPCTGAASAGYPPVVLAPQLPHHIVAAQPISPFKEGSSAPELRTEASPPVKVQREHTLVVFGEGRQPSMLAASSNGVVSVPTSNQALDVAAVAATSASGPIVHTAPFRGLPLNVKTVSVTALPAEAASWDVRVQLELLGVTKHTTLQEAPLANFMFDVAEGDTLSLRVVKAPEGAIICQAALPGDALLGSAKERSDLEICTVDQAGNPLGTVVLRPLMELGTRGTLFAAKELWDATPTVAMKKDPKRIVLRS